MSNDSVCAVSEIYFSYGRNEVLSGISLSAQPGEMVALAGPNGSGKTSLLRILAGLEEPFKGSLELFGRRSRDFPGKERSRRIAYVPQLLPDDVPFTVRQAVSLGRAPWQNAMGIADMRDNKVVLESMQHVRVDHLAERPMRKLSGGERQRVSIARALCQEPDLFLLDEPTAALDYGHQIQIMDMLAALCREKDTTIILVSHDVNLAAMYADRLFLMQKGKVTASGTPDEVLTLEKVSRVYTCSMLVDMNPCTKTPRISPLPMTASY